MQRSHARAGAIAGIAAPPPARWSPATTAAWKVSRAPRLRHGRHHGQARTCGDGQPLVAYAFEAARQKRFAEGSGLPIRISTVELIEIGAGGGSIARADEIGLLKVGPESAGSEPGPAVLWPWRRAPTVTDANLALGILNAETFAGGTIALEPERQAKRHWAACRTNSADGRRPRVRHSRRRQREHDGCRPRPHRRARSRPPQLRRAGHRRRRPGACLRPSPRKLGASTRHLPARCRRRLAPSA